MMPKGIFLSEKSDPLGTSIHDFKADIIEYVLRIRAFLFWLPIQALLLNNSHIILCYMFNLHDASTPVWRNSESRSEIPAYWLVRTDSLRH